MHDNPTFDDPRPPTEEEWGIPLVEPRAAPDVERMFRRRSGMVSGAVPYVVPHPWLHRPFLFLATPSLTALDTDFVAALSFIIARDNSCRFCYSTFRTLLRLSNYTPADLQDLEAHFSMQGFSEQEEWGLRFAVRLSRCTGVAPALDRLAAVGYSDRAVREMAGISVLNLVANRVGTTLSIPVSTFEEMADRWYLRPWRAVALPLLQAVRSWRNGTERAALDDRPEGALSRWTRTLAGTPVGALLHEMVGQWLEADRPLSRRTKLLMLAVVAHGTGATELEAHIQSRLAEAHDCSGAAFEAAVDHFGGPAVDDDLAPLLRLARASIRYDFGPIKRTARHCTEGLDRAATLEAIASISLANALARLEPLFALDE